MKTIALLGASVSDDDFDRVYATDVRSNFDVLKPVGTALRDTNGGSGFSA